MFQPRADLV